MELPPRPPALERVSLNAVTTVELQWRPLAAGIPALVAEVETARKTAVGALTDRFRAHTRLPIDRTATDKEGSNADRVAYTSPRRAGHPVPLFAKISAKKVVLTNSALRRWLTGVLSLDAARFAATVPQEAGHTAKVEDKAVSAFMWVPKAGLATRLLCPASRLACAATENTQQIPLTATLAATASAVYPCDVSPAPTSPQFDRLACFSLSMGEAMTVVASSLPARVKPPFVVIPLQSAKNAVTARVQSTSAFARTTASARQLEAAKRQPLALEAARVSW